MSKQAYNVSGDFQMGRIRQNFVLTVVGEDETAATERAYTELGSRHGVKRREVNIENVEVTTDLDSITAKRLE